MKPGSVTLDQIMWVCGKIREEMISSACSCTSGMLEPFASGKHRQICCTLQYNRAALQYLLRFTLNTVLLWRPMAVFGRRQIPASFSQICYIPKIIK